MALDSLSWSLVTLFCHKVKRVKCYKLQQSQPGPSHKPPCSLLLSNNAVGQYPDGLIVISRMSLLSQPRSLPLSHNAVGQYPDGLIVVSWTSLLSLPCYLVPYHSVTVLEPDGPMVLSWTSLLSFTSSLPFSQCWSQMAYSCKLNESFVFTSFLTIQSVLEPDGP